MSEYAGATPVGQIVMGSIILIVGLAAFPVAEVIDDDHGHNREIREEKQKYPATTTGSVLDLQRVTSGHFTDGSGNQWARDHGSVAVIRYQVDGKTYETKYGFPGLNVGDSVPVVYDPERPSNAKPATRHQIERPHRMMYIYLGIFIVAVGTALISLGVYRVRTSKPD